jgi:hypothetical protein
LTAKPTAQLNTETEAIEIATNGSLPYYTTLRTASRINNHQSKKTPDKVKGIATLQYLQASSQEAFL